MLWEIALPGFVDVTEQLPRHPSRRYERREPGDIRHVIVHHTAGPADQPIWEIARHHVEERGWPGIGYHMVIDARGQAFKTNADLTVSFHAREHNRSSIGVAMLGNFQEQEPPREQYRALLFHVWRYMRAYGISPDRVLGHREVDPTACPGARVDLDRLRRDLDLLDRLFAPR